VDTAPSRAAVRASQAIDRIAGFLRRASAWVTVLAVAALVGAAVVCLAVWREVGPGDDRLGTVLVVGGVAAIPPFLLGRFAWALRALVELPGRLRSSPEVARSSLDDLGLRARAVADAGERGPVRRVLATLRLVRSAASSRDLLRTIVPGAVLLSPAALMATAFAALAAVVEVVIGLLAVLWILAT
jgi:hypothetical protein